MTLHQGTIIWAIVPDQNGHNAYGRPVVIITAESEVSKTTELVGVVASNTAALKSPRPNTYVELPWHPAGRVGTRLKKPTVAVCEWLVAVKSTAIAEMDIGGRVSATVLERIIQTVRSIADRRMPE
jgi:hypothetical protein